MHQIKFSHPYNKLFQGGALIPRAKLLSVEKVRLQDQTYELMEVDTSYKGGRYVLPPRGEYLRLIFLKPGGEGNLFTTFRPARPGKEEYYTSKIGELFAVIIEQTVSAP